ncbi:hypothetical protein [Streptomyces sp. NPDC058254]|uniref:hypothetical protein n=1 Tax=Streptomyces sp. NPDC058254 TaxID=3346406 RepID=UPI0036E4B310
MHLDGDPYVVLTASSAATGTLPGLVAPALTRHLIDAADTTASGYTTAFLVAALVMVLAGLLSVASIRPERDALRLGLDHTTAQATR